jgi:hypothetical protein
MEDDLMNEKKNPLTIVRNCFRAYVDKDQTAIESNPIPGRLSRQTGVQ